MIRYRGMLSGKACVTALVVALLLLGTGYSWGMISGIEAQSFQFTAKAGHIVTGDGNSILVWGYADDNNHNNGIVQYPGPTMIVTAGQPVTVELRNGLDLYGFDMPVSMVIQGQDVTATGGSAGLLANEAPADGGATVVTYTFTPQEPGTYLYHSGTQVDLQVEMGLLGALIVRPSNYDSNAPTAYGDERTAYDNEYLFLLTEMDPDIHELVEFGRMALVDTTTFFPVNWYINGRTAPDAMAPAFAAWLPTQPYNCLPRLNPGDRMLLRFIGGGRDMHPFHTHGNNFDAIARDGRLLESAPLASRDLVAIREPGDVTRTLGTLPDLAYSDFTQTVLPGATYDAIFTWTGAGLGWDMYGPVSQTPHTCNDGNADGFDDITMEYCADHDKPFPVILPQLKNLTFGQFYSGSPFLGGEAFLPPGEGGFNMNNGYFFMWHSHNEKEMVNNDIFPGGMMTMFIVEPPGVVIP